MSVPSMRMKVNDSAVKNQARDGYCEKPVTRNALLTASVVIDLPAGRGMHGCWAGTLTY